MLRLLLAAATLLSTPAYWTLHIDYPVDRAEYERIDTEDMATRRDFYA